MYLICLLYSNYIITILNNSLFLSRANIQLFYRIKVSLFGSFA